MVRKSIRPILRPSIAASAIEAPVSRPQDCSARCRGRSSGLESPPPKHPNDRNKGPQLPGSKAADHFPNTAGSTPIWCDHKSVAAHIWLGLPISDHAQLEMVDLDVVQDWKAVIDRGPSRRVRGAGSPGRGDSAAGSIASQRPRGGSAFFSMKLRPALAADQCRRQRREPPSEGAATRSIWTRGKPMLLFAGPENGCARHHPPRTAAKFNARPRTSSSAAKLCFQPGKTMGLVTYDRVGPADSQPPRT